MRQGHEEARGVDLVLNWTARQALYPNGALLSGCFAQNPAHLEKHSDEVLNTVIVNRERFFTGVPVDL